MSAPDENPFAGILEEIRHRERVKSEISKITQSCSMRTESEILMSAWQYFGDHTETYFEAMNSCGAIVAINEEIEKRVTGFPPHIIIKILETISSLVASQADCQKKILSKMGEINGSTPHSP